MWDGILYFLFFLCLGYFLFRGKLLPENSPGFLSTLLMTVCFPAMILSSFQATDLEDLLTTGLPTVVVTVVFSTLPAVILRIGKKKLPHHNLFSFICGIGNVSFVCIPLLSLFLTEEQMLPVYLHVAVQDLLIWGIFHPVFAGKEKGQQWRALLKEPCLLAAVSGLLLTLFGLSLPQWLQKPIDALHSCVSPLALLFLGMTIAQRGLSSGLRERRALCYTVYKVLLYPLVVSLCLLPFFPADWSLLMAVLFASPAPVAGVVWMQRYTDDPSPAVNCLIPSTLLYFGLYLPMILLLCQQGLWG